MADLHLLVALVGLVLGATVAIATMSAIRIGELGRSFQLQVKHAIPVLPARSSDPTDAHR